MNKNLPDKLKSHFLSLYHLAFSDFDLAPQELEMLYKIALEHNINRDEIEQIILQPAQDYSVPEEDDEKIAYLYDYARLVVADRKIEDAERAMLVVLCEKFGIIDPVVRIQVVDILLQSAQQQESINEILKKINLL